FHPFIPRGWRLAARTRDNSGRRYHISLTFSILTWPAHPRRIVGCQRAGALVFLQAEEVLLSAAVILELVEGLRHHLEDVGQPSLVGAEPLSVVDVRVEHLGELEVGGAEAAPVDIARNLEQVEQRALVELRVLDEDGAPLLGGQVVVLGQGGVVDFFLGFGLAFGLGFWLGLGVAFRFRLQRVGRQPARPRTRDGGCQNALHRLGGGLPLEEDRPGGAQLLQRGQGARLPEAADEDDLVEGRPAVDARQHEVFLPAPPLPLRLALHQPNEIVRAEAGERFRHGSILPQRVFLSGASACRPTHRPAWPRCRPRSRARGPVTTLWAGPDSPAPNRRSPG